MWISKKKWQLINKKITALEKEQLLIKRLLAENVQSNEHFILIVKDLKKELEESKSIYTDLAERFSKWC